MRRLVLLTLILSSILLAAQAPTPPNNPAAPRNRVYRVGVGVSAPHPLYTPDPQYSPEALKAKLQGTVVLFLVVGPDGLPHDVRVARSLGMGLDEKAIEAVRQWKFSPSLKDGVPVAVQINVEVNFRITDGQATPPEPAAAATTAKPEALRVIAAPLPDTAAPLPPAPSDTPTIVRIGAGGADGMLVSRVEPVFPPLALQARIQGVVILNVDIANDGSVQAVKVVTGHPLLVQAAIDAVKQWQYKPYLLNGEPVEVSTRVSVPFTLR